MCIRLVETQIFTILGAVDIAVMKEIYNEALLTHLLL
jgi:hypothetical protein